MKTIFFILLLMVLAGCDNKSPEYLRRLDAGKVKCIEACKPREMESYALRYDQCECKVEETKNE